MYVATLLKDEFVLGYEGRLTALVNRENRTELLKWLRLSLEERGIPHKGQAASKLLSFAAALQHEDLIQDHSLVPYLRAVSGTEQENWKLPHGSPLYRRTFFSITRLAREGAWFCPVCADEDMASQGYSYWRRSHQLPGVDWCNKHRYTTLHQLSSATPFQHQPHSCIKQGISMNYDYSLNTSQREIIQRFIDVSHGILRVVFPMPRESARNLVATRLDTDLKDATRSTTSITLIEQAHKLFPSKWLKIHFPELFTVTSPCNGEPSFPLHDTSHFALALALLFSSATEALDQWLNDLRADHFASSRPRGNSR